MTPVMWNQEEGKHGEVFIMSFFFFFKSIEPFNFYFYLFIFIFGCVVSLFLCEGFLQLRRAGATLHHGARDSQYRGLSCCGAQAPDAQAQQLWLTSPAAPRHVGSSQTRARTHVPCVGRQTLNHCATREALSCLLSYCEPLNWSPGCQHSHLQVPSGLCQGDLSKLPISNMAFLSLVGFIFHFDSYFHSWCHCLSLDLRTLLPSLLQWSSKLSSHLWSHPLHNMAASFLSNMQT